jgi:GTP-binding protein LepA
MFRGIRNFSIVAHIDHGKSTLADRLLGHCGALVERDLKVAQVLDSMELERERGITIKSQPVRLVYRNGEDGDFVLNLIDTPGHVDFTYEVSRSLAACEGALLLIDASQGIQAQTLANYYLALENDLEVIPVINKIDLPTADIEGVLAQIEEVLGIDRDQAILASAKEGTGIDAVLKAVVERIPPPRGRKEDPFRALIFDSWFDSYLGAVAVIRVVDGAVRQGTEITFMSTGARAAVATLGVFTPYREDANELTAGEVGYLTAGIKNVRDARVGDTVTSTTRPACHPIPGYREVKPMVFSGLYPVDSGQYGSLKVAMEKLVLNDPSFSFEPETSAALGFGFRCGFLGMLHMEIIRERLEREYGLRLISTAPTVSYRVLLADDREVVIRNPSEMPPSNRIEGIREPYLEITIIVPDTYLGGVIGLVQERRGIQRRLEYLGDGRVHVFYELPLSEVVFDFYDRLKSVSRGYATLDYEFLEYRDSDVVKLDVMINGEVVDALSTIVHRGIAARRGKELAGKMRSLIPRQLYEVVIQAAIGGRVLAREVVQALRKNVTAKCYGGDVSRKRKLLERQREGKKRMKQVGKVQIPQEAFLAVLKTD